MKTIHRTSRVLEDLFQTALYIAGDNPAAADRFLRHAEDAVGALARMPMIGAAVPAPPPSLAGLRRWSVPGFENYLIFYRPVEDGIEILRVLHGARDIMAALSED